MENPIKEMDEFAVQKNPAATAAEVLKEVQLLGFTHQHPPPKTIS